VAADALIEHRPGQFRLRMDGQDCVLDYQRRGDTVVFTHTGVPAALQGRGLAARLVEAGLQWAQAEGLGVEPACSYVAAYAQRRRRSVPPDAAADRQPVAP
jgi:uncharacterized protein